MTPRTLRNDALDWYYDQGGRFMLAAAVALIALWCIGIAVAGESEFVEQQQPAYQHLAATPPVAAQATDPTVEPPPAPVGSVATTCEWRP